MKLDLRTYLFFCLGCHRLFTSADARHGAAPSGPRPCSWRSPTARPPWQRRPCPARPPHSCWPTPTRCGPVTASRSGGNTRPAPTAVHRDCPASPRRPASATCGWPLPTGARSPTIPHSTPRASRPRVTDYSDRDYYKKVMATNATAYSRAQLGPYYQIGRTSRSPSRAGQDGQVHGILAGRGGAG